MNYFAWFKEVESARNTVKKSTLTKAVMTVLEACSEARNSKLCDNFIDSLIFGQPFSDL